jgi:mRNA-degrading endonuclease toxin of MazEF toxin-antitoxin module
MRLESVLSLDNTLSAEKVHLRKRITALDPAKMRAVCAALDKAPGCS